MITPRRTRLIRVSDLRAFRKAITRLCREEAEGCESRSGLFIVPTRAAAHALRRTVRAAGGTRSPDLHRSFVTRDQLYDDLQTRLPGGSRRLSGFEREALAQAAAASVKRSGPRLSFQLRPGLVSEMLTFYDQLRRQAQQVKRFEELMEDALGTDARAEDRGAVRMLQQTRFLAETFREYEVRVDACGAYDEHLLRERLMSATLGPPLRHVVVTVADWIGDPDGLFVADFDMLARLPGLERLDLVATSGSLDAGYHERLHRWLPGLELADGFEPAAGETQGRPVLGAPPGSVSESWLAVRDREEELRAVARRTIKARRGSPLSACAVVYKQPLPYLYLAPATLGAAGLAFQTCDGLPLAAEPTAAVIDLVLDFVETNFTRRAIVAMLRSPHLRFVHAGREVGSRSVDALDRLLVEARYLGELPGLEEVGQLEPPEAAGPALFAAIAAGHELASLAVAAPASRQLARLLAFLLGHVRPLDDEDAFGARDARARDAVFGLLERLASAHAVHHDVPWQLEQLGAAIRRWLGEETFVTQTDDAGLVLLDDRAARYGEFDEMAIVGLVENEWPERARRNIFYPPRLLQALGWPSERDRRAAAESRFLDLVASPARQIVLSTYTLEDETIVMRSTILDELPRALLSSVPLDADPDDESVFPDEALASGRLDAPALSSEARAWVGLRAARLPSEDPAFHGLVRAVRRDRPWSVSALETYLGCPFRFFSRYVLELEEELDDEEMMDPRRQGALIHRVFERFYSRWQRSGRAAITPVNLDEARALFREVAEEQLTSLTGPEAGLERTRLLGSPAAAGLGEAVLHMEAERPTPVVERLLEHRLTGSATIATTAGPRRVTLRGIVDRLDLLADGTFWLIDYKLGWPPNRTRALQLPIYATWAEQWLSDNRNQRWTLGEAVYVAFKGPRRVVPLFSTGAERLRALANAQQRLADTLDAIERGVFPPTPDDVFRCETCSYASVCRKDYVGDI